jgi:flagellar protein FlaG
MSITRIEMTEGFAESNKLLERLPLKEKELETVSDRNKELPAISKVELEAAVKKLNDLVSAATTIMFSLDEDSGKTIIKVVDMETRTVLRQIPNEEALSMARNMDRLQGLVLRQQA